MCCISQLRHEQNFGFCGTYRVRNIRYATSRSNVNYMSCTLEDATGSVNAYAWNLESIRTITEMSRVTVTCRIRNLNGKWIADLLTAKQCDLLPENPLDLIPVSYCQKPELIEQLGLMTGTIRHEYLKDFVRSILAEDEILLPFVQIPASTNHHHQRCTGLLEHSLDCASKILSIMGEDHALVDLAMIGGLFHDIGKIKTINAKGRLTNAGIIIGHDQLTLEVLAPYLRNLDKKCPDAADSLRYIWTWKSARGGSTIPCTIIAEIVHDMDRISAGMDVAEEAFMDKPEWQRFTKYRDKTLCWRPQMVENKYAA